MVQILEHEEEEDEAVPQSNQSTSTQLTYNTTQTKSSSSSSNPPPPDSPASSPSSISSDHTFHGFSPIEEDPIAPPNPNPPSSQALVPVNRLVRDQPEVVTKTEAEAETGCAGRRGTSGLKRGKLLRRLGLGLRFCEFVICLVSFAVMAADKNRGWALDSFDRYTEFRYSMSANVIGFAYSGLQGLDLFHQLTTGKEFRSKVRYSFDFTIDQILAYLLLSASSSAFTRVDDWISNWGNDKFPTMASASVGVSFLAFIVFAMSALVSGYILCTQVFFEEMNFTDLHSCSYKVLWTDATEKLLFFKLCSSYSCTY